MAGQGQAIEWGAELRRSLTRPRLRWIWLGLAVATVVPTAGCVWTLVVNLPAALEGDVAGARTLQWAMVLFTLLGGLTLAGSWRLYRESRERARVATGGAAGS